MKNRLFGLWLVTIMIYAGSASAQTTWTIDKVHTNVGFTVTHMVVSEVSGRFKEFSGSVSANNEDFSDAKIDVAIQTASVNTDNEYRDGHLKSDDFFGSEKFPTAYFKSTGFEKVSGKKYKITGDLTIKGVTKSVVLDATFGGVISMPDGSKKAGFKASTEINRFDYGLNWNKVVEAGAVVADEVTIQLNVELDYKPAKS